jgi:fatty acid desaturase
MNLSDRAKAIIEAVAFIALLIVNLIAWLAGWTVPAIIITGVQLIVGWLIGKTFVWPKLPNTSRAIAPDVANAIAVERRRIER